MILDLLFVHSKYKCTTEEFLRSGANAGLELKFDASP